MSHHLNARRRLAFQSSTKPAGDVHAALGVQYGYSSRESARSMSSTATGSLQASTVPPEAEVEHHCTQCIMYRDASHSRARINSDYSRWRFHLFSGTQPESSRSISSPAARDVDFVGNTEPSMVSIIRERRSSAAQQGAPRACPITDVGPEHSFSPNLRSEAPPRRGDARSTSRSRRVMPDRRSTAHAPNSPV